MRQQKRPPAQLCHAVFESSLDAIMVVDRTGTIVYSNPQSRTLFGYAADEFAGLHVKDLVPQEVRDKHGDLCERFFANPHARPVNTGLDTVARRKDGATFPVEVALQPVKTKGGVYTAAVVRDVTTRLAEVDRARQATSLLRSTLESTADGILVVDREGRITTYNEKFADMWGIPLTVLSSGQDEQALQFVLDQLADRDGFLARVQELYASPEAVSFDTIEFTDGRVFERYSQPQRLGGDVVGRVWSFRDVTMSRTSEWALQRSEESLRTLVDNAVFAIYRSTPDGHLVMANNAMARMLGYDSAAELMNVPDISVIYRDPAERSRLINEYRDRRVVENLDVEWKRKDGQVIDVRLNGRPVRNPQGRLEYFEMLAEDVTERRVLEQQLRQAQKMEAVGVLAGGIAHDFNNILTAILGTAELALQSLPADSPLRDNLNDVRDAAQRGAALTRKLLAFGRKQPLELRPIRLAHLLQEFTPVLRRVIREDIRIVVHTLDNDAVVRADAGAIEQILMNLTTNARDAMPHGGSLVIQTEQADFDRQDAEHLGFGAPGRYTVLTVSDTGIGMNAETRLRVFEPFFTTKAAGAGTGLGMAMVYGLVKQHGGFVVVDSTPGIGTTVRVYLPLRDERPEEPARRPTPQQLTGSETILLVEDEESVRRVAKRTLERHGYNVIAAADGVEAFDLFLQNERQIHLVMSDMVMPRMNGTQLVRAIRQRNPSVKVLLASGYASAETMAVKAENPGVPVLTKPWVLEDLLRTLRELLERG